MAVVKADGYGHGAELVARARSRTPAPTGWASSTSTRRLALRACGHRHADARLAARPGRRLRAAVEAGIDLGISSLEQLERAAATDSGLGRGRAAQGRHRA